MIRPNFIKALPLRLPGRYHSAMRTSAISLASLALLASLIVTVPASAQAAPLVGGVVSSSPGQEVVVMQPSGFADTAVASCAGGAAIGYLAVVATGGVTPLGTAAMFCGLSVAATAASTVAVWTWRTMTSRF
jgi:hypothetical protein